MREPCHRWTIACHQRHLRQMGLADRFAGERPLGMSVAETASGDGLSTSGQHPNIACSRIFPKRVKTALTTSSRLKFPSSEQRPGQYFFHLHDQPRQKSV
jgi:hypothetical protein